MIQIDIQGKWLLFVFTSNNHLLDYLEKINCSEKDIKNAIRVSKSINSGFTFTNPTYKTTIMYISKASSRAQWFNTLVHELKHVQSHICSYYNIDEKGEEAAYLIRYLMQKIIKYIQL